MSFSERLIADWYRPRLTALTAALLPLSGMFRVAVAARRALYRLRVLRAASLRAPVVVVGSILVGGTGKTPLTRALAQALADRGWHPGLVARGYGGSSVAPRAVSPTDDPGRVGDESLLLAADGIPVWIGQDRVAAARALLATHAECDLVIADDGLQHYALARNVEVAVIDGERGLGNACMLPAGPLREPRARLDGVDAVVELVADDLASASRYTMRYEPRPWRNLVRGEAAFDSPGWSQGSVHAIAGIGNPSRFFALLRRLGLDPVCHAFPDHHRYTHDEVEFPGAAAILMTEKDAVKCSRFADQRFWYLPIQARIDSELVAHVARKLRGSQAA